MREGLSDMHCRSDQCLSEELMDEYEEAIGKETQQELE